VLLAESSYANRTAAARRVDRSLRTPWDSPVSRAVPRTGLPPQTVEVNATGDGFGFVGTHHTLMVAWYTGAGPNLGSVQS
jgi:hypothetical protein